MPTKIKRPTKKELTRLSRMIADNKAALQKKKVSETETNIRIELEFECIDSDSATRLAEWLNHETEDNIFTQDLNNLKLVKRKIFKVKRQL